MTKRCCQTPADEMKRLPDHACFAMLCRNGKSISQMDFDGAAASSFPYGHKEGLPLLKT
jgi:hypothetical protein